MCKIIVRPIRVILLVVVEVCIGVVHHNNNNSNNNNKGQVDQVVFMEGHNIIGRGGEGGNS